MSFTNVNCANHPAAGPALRLLESLAGQALPDAQDLAPDTVQLAAGETLFEAGEVHPAVYVVERGLLKLRYLNEQGDEWIKSFSTEGMFFGSLAALEPGGRASFGVVALERCRLERLDWARLLALAERHPAWMRALLRAMQHFAALKEAREHQLLTRSPEQRYVALQVEAPMLAERVPQKDLARFLGITPVSLSRLRGRRGETRGRQRR